MRDNLNEFVQKVRDAPSDKQAERFVRIMLKRVSGNCPIDLLVQLGQCVADYRKSELRDEAEQN